jgi:16S rRNA (adenine1518-N6/adenine1519-N6)-dimethyltransferase
MAHQFKKKFGQNFLRDENLLKKIVQDASISDEDVIEIGPGMGALTKHIVLYAKTVTAYEVDTSLKTTLNQFIEKHKNLQVIYQDILDVDLSVYEFPISVIGNIPYNITSPIIFKLIEYHNIHKIVIMIQKEVANRIVAKPNTKDYNGLSVILQTCFKIEKIVDVNKKMFYPVPKVDSAVIKMTKITPLDKAFQTFVKACFKQKRKTLANNLLEANIVDKKSLFEHLKQLNYKEDIRAEALTPEDFKHLFQRINHDTSENFLNV